MGPEEKAGRVEGSAQAEKGRDMRRDNKKKIQSQEDGGGEMEERQMESRSTRESKEDGETV